MDAATKHPRIAELVAIGDASQFDQVREILHDSEYVQVRLADVRGNLRTYAHRLEAGETIEATWARAQSLANLVQEVAALVSAGALVAWLIDNRFTFIP